MHQQIDKMGLSGGAIVAIVLSSIFVLLLLGYSWHYYYKKKPTTNLSFVVGRKRTRKKMSKSFAKYLRSYIPVEEDKQQPPPTMLYSDEQKVLQDTHNHNQYHTLPVLDQDIIRRDDLNEAQQEAQQIPSFVKTMS